MRTRLLSTLIGASLTATVMLGSLSSAAAQSPKTDVISVNLLDAIDGYFNAGWEHVLGDSWSLYLGAEVLAFRGVFDDYEGSVVALGPVLGANLYLIGDAPQGLFLGPFVIGSWVRVSDGTNSASDFGYAFGGRIGGAALIGSFHLSAGIGAVWRAFSVDINESDLGPRGFRPRFELSLGYAF